MFKERKLFAKMLYTTEKALHYCYEAEHLEIQPWGPNALRVRSTKLPSFPSHEWALSEPVPSLTPHIDVPQNQGPLPAPGNYFSDVQYTHTSPASIKNGSITASLTTLGKLTINNNKTGKTVLEEYWRHALDVFDPKCSTLNVPARQFKPHGTGAEQYSLTYRLESQSLDEKLFGMGQYQQPYLNLKGQDLELAQRNSQASIPFLVSSLGYGFLWNNPAIGRAALGNHVMTFEAMASNVLDFWIVVGVSPREILSRYADVTGHCPMMPEYGLGFWQCKLRYQTQEEVLTVAREYKRRHLPIDAIVIDFFHWPKQGEWKFDSNFWPDPEAMIQELADMDIKVVVSVWPTVDKRSENYNEMMERGYLIRAEKGIQLATDFMGGTIHTDFTNPEAQKYVWRLLKQNYFDLGVRCFWLDEAEPSFSAYDFDNYRYWSGTLASTGNIYPLKYAQALFEGQISAGQGLGGADGIINLIRCAWAGAQKYAVVAWSGDVASSWISFKCQLAAGLNVGMAGIPWWNSDIGGFDGGTPEDPQFQELLVRWFQWATFTPLMRLHGHRHPKQPKVGEGGGSDCLSGAPNELWCFGETNYPILVRYLRLRERLRGYIRRLMQEASSTGAPVIRTMFFEFPEDDMCWQRSVEGQYMFGDKYLCVPVTEPGMRVVSVYLPKGAMWVELEVGDAEDSYGRTFNGGQTIEVSISIKDMPVFVKMSLD